MFFTNHEYDIELANWIYSALGDMSKIGFFWTIKLKRVSNFAGYFCWVLTSSGKEIGGAFQGTL